MKKIILLFVCLCFSFEVTAGQSTIQVAEGMACMGYDKSRKQTETEAVANAKRNASEFGSTTLKTQTDVVDFELQKDLVQAFSEATVKMIKEISASWYEEHSLGACYKVTIQAEIIPNEVVMKEVEKKTKDDPTAPLNVSIWTNEQYYKKGETVKIYLKGNKPFFARVVYQDAENNLIQLVPNPHRTDYYFEGGVISEIPSGLDKFELEVTPPFGAEKITVYASTSPMDNLAVEDVGSVYLIETAPKDVGVQTRGISIKKKSEHKKSQRAEFAESTVLIETGN